ncbi:hypothetical protein BDN70DRAFT_344053 [Pholiota conissans]|uniref:Uncharacterized protein n=1 Tax=Pholiota conissans TaxID=109636 RepID=A0A9P5YUC6_9AGAR|nr:hypothetical protein BDN70DRAFT_344053 [Pholiota conissans]
MALFVIFEVLKLRASSSSPSIPPHTVRSVVQLKTSRLFEPGTQHRHRRIPADGTAKYDQIDKASTLDACRILLAVYSRASHVDLIVGYTSLPRCPKPNARYALYSSPPRIAKSAVEKNGGSHSKAVERKSGCLADSKTKRLLIFHVCVTRLLPTWTYILTRSINSPYQDDENYQSFFPTDDPLSRYWCITALHFDSRTHRTRSFVFPADFSVLSIHGSL